MPIIEIFYFCVLLYLVFYLPGRFLLGIFKQNFDDPWISLPLSLSLGVSLFVLITYLLSFIGLEFLYNLILIPLIAYQIKNLLRRPRINVKKIVTPELILILLGSFAMTFVTMQSGLGVEKGLVFYGNNARDGIYHMSLVGNLMNYFPPTHPELAEIPLRGYHFFYDLLVAEFSRFYQINYIDLIFRYFPFFLAFFYGLSGLALVRFLKMPRFSIIVFMFLIYFAGGIEMILNKFWGVDKIYSTGMNPLLVNILNPSLLLSVCLIFAIFILGFKNNKRSVVLPILLLGIMPQLKIYAAILTFASLGVVALNAYYKKRDSYYLKVTCASVPLAIIVFAPFNLGSGGVVFTPLLLYKHFMETFSAAWASRLMVFDRDILRLIYLYFVALAFYFLPTLGPRLISIVSIKKLIRKEFYTERNIFWIVFIFTGLAISSLFIQSVDSYNIVQFLWFGYIILLIPTALVLSDIVIYFRGGRFLKILFFAGVVLISIPHLLDIFHSYTTSVYFIEKERVLMAGVIKKEVPPDSGLVVLNVDGDRSVYDLPEIAALSLHPTYYESTITSYVDSDSIRNERKKEIGQMENLVKYCVGDVNNTLKDIMNRTNNVYILTLTEYSCFSTLKDFKLVKKVGQHNLYKLTYEKN